MNMTQPFDSIKLLLVEDNELNRDMLSRRLQRRGFQVSTATDGATAVKVTGDIMPDIILMDMGLPGMNGWDATRMIKANVATRHIPVIALTAHAMTGDRQLAIAAGCDAFETKPIDLECLLETIRMLTASRRQEA
jgi:CheY-like chemotaxis protein